MTIILEKMIQGEKEWHDARRGCITMSRSRALTTNGKGGAPSKTRESYILDVVAEQASGITSLKLNSDDVQRGNLLESDGLAAYELETGHKVKTVGLGYLDERRTISASPDGLIEAIKRGLEIKCPAPKQHLRYILAGGIHKDHNPQVQGGMWVFGFDSWDFISYCPQYTPMPLVIYTVKRDEEMIRKISESAELAVKEVKEFLSLSKAEVSESLQKICDISLEKIDLIFGDSEEIT